MACADSKLKLTQLYELPLGHPWLLSRRPLDSRPYWTISRRLLNCHMADYPLSCKVFQNAFEVSLTRFCIEKLKLFIF